MARTIDRRIAVDPVAVLVAQYRAAITAIAKRLEAGKLLPNSYLARQVPFIIAALGELDVFAKRWAQRQIAEAYRKGAAVALAELRQAGIPIRSTAFQGFDTAAATALVTRTSARLANIRNQLVQGLLGGEKPTSAQAVRLMRQALGEDGRTVQVRDGSLKVRVPSGRYWKADAYARMEGKTATFDALRVARRGRYLRNGVDVVIVTSTGTSHAECAVWEGRRLSLTGMTPGLPTPEDARADGLWHPNCEHSYYPAPLNEQPGGDLTQEEQPNFPTLGERPSQVRVSVTSRIRRKIAETLASS